MTFTCSTKDQLSLQTFLRSVPIFSNLSEENLNHLIRITAQMRLSEGVYLFEEGSIGRYFFVIEEGEIEICTTSGDKELLLAVRKPGEIIGELSLLDKLPRMASARARTWCNVLIIPREAFDRLILANPSLHETFCIPSFLAGDTQSPSSASETRKSTVSQNSWKRHYGRSNEPETTWNSVSPVAQQSWNMPT